MTDKTRLELMQEFREAMASHFPDSTCEDGVYHPGFKLRPEVFKYAQSEFLFKVWCNGRDSVSKGA